MFGPALSGPQKMSAELERFSHCVSPSTQGPFGPFRVLELFRQPSVIGAELEAIAGIAHTLSSD